MTRTRNLTAFAACVAFAAVSAYAQDAAQEKDAAATSDDLVLKALSDELGRSMALQLEELKSPYFVEYSVNERTGHRIEASCGAIQTSSDSRSRRLSTSVRVGYYDLDNSNFAGDGGGRRGIMGGGGGRDIGGMASLPIEDSYTAIRQAAWLSTDSAYKSAVETLARKEAFMEGQQVEERPNDFARSEPTVSIKPKAQLAFDARPWEQRLRTVSKGFLKHPHVLDSHVSLSATADTQYLVNSEGTKIRQGALMYVLSISAQAQAADGAPLSEIVTRYADTPEGLPAEADLLLLVDELAGRLSGRLTAPSLDHYIGPVLFEGEAAPLFFEAMLAPGITGRPEPVGGGRRRFAGVESLDRYLGKRILPSGFHVYDDPRTERINDTYLAGHYEIDDEGVPAQRVNIVVDGRLEGMLMSRAPISNFDGSNGHGRSSALGRPQAALGCLYIESAEGIASEDLRRQLADTVKDQGLEYGLRITGVAGASGAAAAMRAAGRGRGGAGFPGGGAGGGGEGSSVGDPIAVYKVYPDGHEELVRGCEFGSIDVGALKDILAVGREPVVLNTRASGGVAASIIAPPILLEEVELFKIDQEPGRLPIVPAPHQRTEG